MIQETIRTRFAPFRHTGLLTVFGAALLLAGCGSDPVPSLDLQLEELPSPGRGWSGEPHLAASARGPVLSWLETGGGPGQRSSVLAMDRWTGNEWEGRREIVASQDLLVNWADFPAVVALDDGLLVAHWLVRDEPDGYAYSIRVATSEDGGQSWSEAWKPHEDDALTEHGFVSVFPIARPAAGAGDSTGTRFGLVWLDGRDMVPAAPAEAGGEPTYEGAVALRFRTASASGPTGPDALVDERTCECCQTDVAMGPDGPVVAYRDRTREEVRDIHVIRLLDGKWSPPRPVHDDGWVFPACPVNGPAIDARDDRLAVAWFTGAGDAPRVQLAFSSDGGTTFGSPIRIDEGNPSGRVDTVLLPDGTALVSWIERDGAEAHVRVRRVAPGGEVSPPADIGGTGAGRSSGFPQMVPDGRGGILFAWTDSREGESRVRVARADLTGSTAAGSAPDVDP